MPVLPWTRTEKKQFTNPTQFNDINNLLADWAKGVKKISDQNLIGLYLSGSLAYGDFLPKRSDIDLQAVLKRPLNAKELGSLNQLHEDLNERHPAWKNRMECSYVWL